MSYKDVIDTMRNNLENNGYTQVPQVNNVKRNQKIFFLPDVVKKKKPK
jgi:hypothetical protein